MSGQTRRRSKSRNRARGITAVSVRGYKSLYDECRLEIRPLTVLAGANSSGKSSAMQPILLLKQTLEASYDPGPLLIDGPNVRFTSADQMLSQPGKNGSFSIDIEVDGNQRLSITFEKRSGQGISIREMRSHGPAGDLKLTEEMSHDEILRVLPEHLKAFAKDFAGDQKSAIKWRAVRNRCFLGFTPFEGKTGVSGRAMPFLFSPSMVFELHIGKIIHLPGLRGNPERTYKTTAIGQVFPGTFENYVASMVYEWQQNPRSRPGDLADSLERLGLTWKIQAKPIDETQVELRVGRLIHAARGGAYDLVSIADAGFGVSQTLPVLVALLVASPGQLVYIEQPEIHLHPRAQVALAELLADAAKRGVKVVVETHSSLLLKAIQSLVAEGNLSPQILKLHWFERDKNGATTVRSADLDEAGAFGDWPEDFAEVAISAESRYLDAVDARKGAR